jgi:elongator complex protein 1
VKPACQPSISLINDGFCHHSGARLVTTVSGQAKVIIQLPRGNLETFEARPLVLMQARQLLDNDQIFDCVVLLRRQKVDINYIVDYDSKRFLDNVSSFVSDSLAKNADILSLLVSSLEPNYNSLLKYQYRFQQLSQQQQLEQQQVLLTGNDKINVVCGALRVELLKLLREQNMTAALNPVLCTFAKQRPPLLSDGLGLISDLYCGGASHSSSSSTRSMQLASSKVQSAIKYLLFLADGVEVFNAALG